MKHVNKRTGGSKDKEALAARLQCYPISGFISDWDDKQLDMIQFFLDFVTTNQEAQEKETIITEHFIFE